MSEGENLPFNFQVGGVRDVQQAFRTVEESLLRLEKLAAKRGDTEEKSLLKIGAAERKRAQESKDAENRRTTLAALGVKKREQDEVALFRELESLEKKHTALVESETKKRVAAEEAASKRRLQYGRTMGQAGMSSVSRIGSAAVSYGAMALAAGGGFAIADAGRSLMSKQQAATGLANSMYNPSDKQQMAELKGGRFKRDDMLSKAREAHAATGVGEEELLGGWQDYIAKSSDYKALTTDDGMKTMGNLAKMAKAEGANFGEVMGAAGSLRVQNKNLGSKEMTDMMYAIIGQGKMGSVEMKDVAKHASVMTAGSSLYAGDQATAQKSLLGMSQIAARAAASPAEAATAVARFSSDVAKKAKVNEKDGSMKVTDGSGHLLANSELLKQYFLKSEGSLTKMGEGKGNLGLGLESIKLAQGAASDYNSAVEDAKAGNVSKATRDALKLGDKKTFNKEELNKIGAESVRQEAAKFENAGYSQKTIDEDHALVMADAGERIKQATEKIRSALEVKLAPFIEKLADAFASHSKDVIAFMDALEKVASFMLENPFTGVGLVVSAAISKDIADAAIGQSIKNMLETKIGGQLGGAFSLLTIAVLATAAGMEAINLAMKDKADAEKKLIGADINVRNEASNLQAKIDNGTATPADLKRAQEIEKNASDELAKNEQADPDEVRFGLKKGSYLGEMANVLTRPYAQGGAAVAGMVDDDATKAAKAAHDAEIKRAKDTLESFHKTVEAAGKAIKWHADQTVKVPPAGAPVLNTTLSSPGRGGGK